MGDVPLDFQPQMQNISQQQKLSQMLLQQGMQQPQGQMVSGHYVAPALTQYLQPLFGAYAGSKGMETAENKQLELAKAIRQVGTEEVQNILETYKKDPNAALQLASNAQTPQAKALAAQLSKSVLLEPTTLEREWKAAQAQGFKGTINDFKNQMTEAQRESNRIDRARLNLSAQEQAFNLGLPMAGGYGGGMPQQAPLQTINPGSPILAPGQQAPQQGMPMQGMPQGQVPRFNSKAEQDLWLSKQKKVGELQAEALNALPGAELKVQSAITAIQNMIGDTTVDKSGNLVLGKNKPHAGFYEAVGMPSITNAFGLTGLFPGSDVQDFKSEFSKVGGQAFLQAVETLRGTGAISETEGKKATDAITSMSLAQSEKSFVKAANDFKDAIKKGYVATQQRAGVASFNPAAAPAGTQPKFKYNLQTGQWE